MKVMDFQYYEENRCFSMERHNILFSRKTRCQLYKSVAGRLAKNYRARLLFAVEYIVGNKEFFETYG